MVTVPQAISGSGALTAVNITTDTTTIATSGAATSTMAAGQNGQEKTITMITDGGDCVVTVTNLAGGTTLTFNDVFDSITLKYLNSLWTPISNIGVTIA